ncbi:MAG TPA: cytidine deaminase [Candidatus Fimimonas merdipullorum]|uniref:Cytidine deaminase n=1 Tax=Candidatus Fimimonas merdipullorum TaxID=2840822 RepID=A0A9D1MWP5_9BACT|nr:cytidine deaminase [Candidatus Fimimonas merdipullorum]
MTDYKQLVKAAYEAQKMAYAPYSHWVVGAALLTAEGKIYKGCNIESATFSPTVCAERTAFFKAVSEGERHFAAIAIVGNAEGTAMGKADVCPPCGVCRQVMTEFCGGDFEIVLAKNYDDYAVYTLAELMPLVSLPIK